MIPQDLHKHAREFVGYLKSHKYETTNEGVVFPQAHAVIGGEYSFYSNDERDTLQTQRNLLPTQSLNYLLETGLRGGTARTQFFLALFGSAYTPTDGLTASTFPTLAGEIVSATEGYTESSRRPWVSSAVASASTDNTASRAAFTIATATQLTIRGAALVSDSVKGGTNGVLISATRFAVDRIEANGNVFNLGYRVFLEPQ